MVLFDIDGTLVEGPSEGPSAGVRAMRRASRIVTGEEGYFGSPHFAGRTDTQIARMLIESAGDPNPRDEDVWRLASLYVELLAEEIPATPYRALGDAAAAVEGLGASGCVIGLGTGNLRTGGELKLESAGVAHLFDFDMGGYCEDGESRAELLAVGASRCDQTGRLPVVIVGDTPRDVEAAHAIGAVCIGVPFRSNDARTLREAGADRVVEEVGLAIPPLVADLLRSRE